MFKRMLTATVCAVAILAAGLTVKPAAAQGATQPVVRITDILVNEVVLNQAGQLVAIADVTLDVLGRTITEEVRIPLTLGGTANGPCPILHLSLGPVHLDVLGLVVNLDNCDGGAVTVDITAIPTGMEGGGLLGDLLCGLLGGIDLGDILGDLLPGDLPVLGGILTDVLNAVFDRLLSTAVPSVIAHQHGGGGHVCDILTLEIDEISLNLLGLFVETSPICLDVHAERGGGNLLGNLLCNLVGLLDTNASNNALQAHVRNILRLLDRLGL
jgi:hypothetical protein